MKQYEYKHEYVKFEAGSTREEQILDAANKHGRDGWRLNRLSIEASFRTLVSFRGGINLMLERETAE